jgi:hypothetical protein
MQGIKAITLLEPNHNFCFLFLGVVGDHGSPITDLTTNEEGLHVPGGHVLGFAVASSGLVAGRCSAVGAAGLEHGNNVLRGFFRICGRGVHRIQAAGHPHKTLFGARSA